MVAVAFQRRFRILDAGGRQVSVFPSRCHIPANTDSYGPDRNRYITSYIDQPQVAPYLNGVILLGAFRRKRPVKQ
jgi:hypothetical protein